MQVYFSKRFPKYLEEFAYFAMNDLGISELRGEIDIKMKRRIDGDCFGFCLGNDRQVDIQIATHMCGEPISRTNKLLTVAHELVHARQCLRRELFVNAKGETVWQGADQSHNTEALQSSHGVQWETEAFALQQGLVDNWYK
jgi:hypothetical protein